MAEHCSAVSLRTYQAADKRAVCELLQGLTDLYPGGSEWLDARLDLVLELQAHCTLAVQGLRPVGVMIETPKPENRLKVSTLYVSPACRGAGIGRMLIQAGLRRWLDQRLRYVYVTVDYRLAEQIKRLVAPHGFETVAIDHNRYGNGRHETVLGRFL
jgi:ribosomal protein S18 acetylase RimI-like enzyme